MHIQPPTTNSRLFSLSPVVWARACCGRPMTWEVYLAAYVCTACGNRA